MLQTIVRIASPHDHEAADRLCDAAESLVSNTTCYCATKPATSLLLLSIRFAAASLYACAQLHVTQFHVCCLLLQIAVDFVSPESMAAALDNREQLRTADLSLEQQLGLGPEDRRYQEKLQSQLMLLRGVLRADDLMAQH